MGVCTEGQTRRTWEGAEIGHTADGTKANAKIVTLLYPAVVYYTELEADEGSMAVFSEVVAYGGESQSEHCLLLRARYVDKPRW